jgi:peptide/nickel transport system permease protein
MSDKKSILFYGFLKKAASFLPWRYIFLRILQMIPTLLGISIISFVIVQIAPMDFTAQYRLNPQFSEEMLQQLIQRYGLDKPVTVQYLRWLWNATHLDFGESTKYVGMKVFALISSRALVTLRLSLLVMVFTWLISVPLGIFCAMRQYTFSDKVFSVIAFIGMSLPTFFVAFLLLMLAGSVDWLPPGGLSSVGYERLSFWGKMGNYLWHMAIPAAVMILSSVAGLMRIMRGNVLEVKTAQYITTARAKGLSGKKVIFKHILRNAINPMITIFGYQLSALLSGVGLTEAVLAYPGLGKLMLDAVLSQDIYLVMGGLMMSSVLVLVGNLIADILLAIVDPRIKVGGKGQ